MENLSNLVLELCKLPAETTWVEFKHNNWSPQMIGEDISALANSAVLADRNYAYMIWGVEDETHNIVGTDVRLPLEKKGNQEIGCVSCCRKMQILNFILLILTANMLK